MHGRGSTITSPRERGQRGVQEADCRPGAPIDNVVSDPEYISDEELVRFADNVFVGRVIKRVGNEPAAVREYAPLPQTLFS